MANILIAYVSQYGQTAKIARRIADIVTAHGDSAELLNTASAYGDLALDRFGAVVVCAPVHAAGYPKPIMRFAKAHARELERVMSVFCSVGLAVLSKTSDGREQTLHVVDEFVKKTGWHPSRVELLAGALPYTKYNFFIRFVMRRIVKSEGGDIDTSRDYEYTDWAEVERFASQLSADASNRARGAA